MRYLKGFIVAMTFFLIAFLAIGFALSGEWRAERSVTVAAPASAVWPLVADLRRWDEWAPLGEVEADYPGPTSGPGAVRAWDDRAWGSGSVTVVDVADGVRLVYDVEVDGGLATRGTIELAESAGGGPTRVTWREQGDFGWNPLLSWFAWGMETRQGAQLQRGLDRLRAAVEGG